MYVFEKFEQIEEKLKKEINKTGNESAIITVSVSKKDSFEIQEKLKEKGYEANPMLSWSNDCDLLVINKYQE